MKLGVIGVGHLATSILSGLRAAQWDSGDILLSPRGHSAALSERYGYVLAEDNAELVEKCSRVLLAVRPKDAVGAIDGLPWRDHHILMSACAGVPIARLRVPARPATVIRLMPLTAAELGASPTAVFPMDPQIAPLLSAIGTAIPLENEDQFDVATVSAAIYGWLHMLIRDSAEWSAAQHMDEQAARRLVAHTFVAAGRMVAESDAPMAHLLDSLCTPGGITEAGLRHLDEAAVPDAWRGACDLVLHKLRDG